MQRLLARSRLSSAFGALSASAPCDICSSEFRARFKLAVGIFVALLRVAKMRAELFVDFGERVELLLQSRQAREQVPRVFLDLLALASSRRRRSRHA